MMLLLKLQLLMLLLELLLLLHKRCGRSCACRRSTRRRSFCGYRFELISASHVNDDRADDQENDDDDGRQQRAQEHHVRRGRRGQVFATNAARGPTSGSRLRRSGFGHRTHFGPFQPKFRGQRRLFVVVLQRVAKWPEERQVDQDVDFALLATAARQSNSPYRRNLRNLTCK